MRRTVVIYDAATGVPRSRWSGDDSHLKVPDGCAVHDGDFDINSARIDLQTGEVVDYEPPAPSPDLEWNPENRRHELSERAYRRMDAQSRIEALERKQARRIRELLAEQDPSLKEIDQQVAELRRELVANSDPKVER